MIHKLIRFFLLVTLCMATGTVASAVNSENAKLEKVSLQLKWLHSFQFAGYYAAKNQGYYREEGLDVTFIEPLASKADRLVEPVLNGTAEFGVWSSELINERLSGKPIVLLAVIFQHSPYIFLSRKDAGIRAPSDMVGRKVAIGSGLVQFQAMLLNEGLSLDGVEIISRTGRVDDIIDGRADAVLSYITDQPNQMRMRGVEHAILRPSDYGIDFYGDSLFTSEAELEQHPERVEAFRRASLKGWEYALSHKDELIELILSMPGVKERGLSFDHLRYEAEQTHKLILPKLIQIGHINPGRLKHIAETYVKLGLLDSDYSLEGFIYRPQSSADNSLLYTLLALLVGTFAVIIIGWGWNRQLASAIARQTLQSIESNQRYRKLVEETADQLRINQSVMEPLSGKVQSVYLPAILGGIIVSLLGASVIFGWVTHNATLIQISAAFAPMQFNTSLSFLLSGLGVLAVIRGWNSIAIVTGIAVLLTGLLTLTEYIFNIDLGIDELLMTHDITLLTSHPGRMAPNTALCFSLAGAALVVKGLNLSDWKPDIIVGTLGSIILGLSVVALSGYVIGIETAYGWGELTRMAVHTAIGFVFLGMAIPNLTAHRGIPCSSGRPIWFPIPIGIGVMTIVMSLWQALESQETILMNKYGISGDFPIVNEILLLIGIVLAFALSLATYLAQTSRNREQQVAVINHRLLVEIDEREEAEKALREGEERFRGLFENAEVSIWNEDFTSVFKELNKLRLDGIKDLRQYLVSNKQRAWDIAAMIKVLHVNKATLKLFCAKSEQEFLYQIDKTFGANAIDVFIEELSAIWNKQKEFRSEATFITLDGKEINAIISFRIPELEKSFQSIPVTIIDITERKKSEAEIEKQIRELHRWQNIILGRENRNLELKTEINALCMELGRPPLYPGAKAESDENKS